MSFHFTICISCFPLNWEFEDYNSNVCQRPTYLVVDRQHVDVSVTEGSTAYVEQIFLFLITSDEEHLPC